MMMMVMFSPVVFLLFFAGGENSLSGFVDHKAYWQEQGIQMEAEALRGVLQDGGRLAVDEDALNALVEQLGAPEHAKREAAMRELAKMGPRIRPMLEQATENADPEISTRVTAILKEWSGIKIQSGLNRQMAILGLVALEDRESLDLLRTIAESGESLEAKMAARAVGILSAKEENEVVLEARNQILARFPEVTFCLGQLTPRSYGSSLLPQLRQLGFVSTHVKQVIGAVGDVEIHRISAGMNQEVLQDEDRLLGMVYIEMDYHSLPFAKWLMSRFQFSVSQQEDMIFLYRNHVVAWPISDQKLLLVFHGDPQPTDAVMEVIKGFEAPREQIVLNDMLVKAVEDVPPEADLWIAAHLPEEARIPLAEAKVFDRVSSTIQFGKENIQMKVMAVGEEKEAVDRHTQQRKAQRDALVAQFGNHAGGIAPERFILNALRDMKIEAEGKAVRVQAEFSMELLLSIMAEFNNDVQLHRGVQ